MEKQKNYFEHPGKAVETDGRFEHVMAISLDPRTDYKHGVIRCITSREGDVEIKGYVDRSVLYKVTGNSLEHFDIGVKLEIKNQKEIIDQIKGHGDFIGLEDPDIWIDEKTGLMHMYFTIPIRNKHTITHLGHAVGENLDSLKMTMPVLMAGEGRAKEFPLHHLINKDFVII